MAPRDPSGFFERMRRGELRPTDAETEERRRRSDHIQTLDRGLAAICAFTDNHDPLSVTEVAERAKLSRAAARRILLTLKRLGYVSTTENGLYRLEPTVLSLGYANIASQDFPEVASPYMESLANELQGTSSIGVLRGTDVTFVARVRAPAYLTSTLGVGSSIPAHLTAMGRVLLADLSDDEVEDYLQRSHTEPFTELTLTSLDALRQAIHDARRTGYAFENQELVTGVIALAVPIRLRSDRRAIAGLNIAFADPRVNSTNVQQTHLPVLQRAADSIRTALRSVVGVEPEVSATWLSR